MVTENPIPQKQRWPVKVVVCVVLIFAIGLAAGWFLHRPAKVLSVSTSSEVNDSYDQQVIAYRGLINDYNTLAKQTNTYTDDLVSYCATLEKRGIRPDNAGPGFTCVIYIKQLCRIPGHSDFTNSLSAFPVFTYKTSSCQ